MSTAQRSPSYAALVQDLADRGLLDSRWRAVFEAVPRRQFIPPAIWRQRPDGCERIVAAGEWLALVNSDEPVVIQLDDGVDGGPGIATSSNSQPSMVARMLGLLQVKDGQRVLEIGTASGYVAALLSERLRRPSTALRSIQCWPSRLRLPLRVPGTGRTCDATTARHRGRAWPRSIG